MSLPTHPPTAVLSPCELSGVPLCEPRPTTYVLWRCASSPTPHTAPHTTHCTLHHTPHTDVTIHCLSPQTPRLETLALHQQPLSQPSSKVAPHTPGGRSVVGSIASPCPPPPLQVWGYSRATPTSTTTTPTCTTSRRGCPPSHSKWGTSPMLGDSPVPVATATRPPPPPSAPTRKLVWTATTAPLGAPPRSKQV